MAALEHPHIVRVFAFGEHAGHPYLAMEFVPGGTLAERVKKSGPLPAQVATELMAKLAAAVAHAHSRGVVHRDIKPLNILLTADGEPRLTDFGLAKVGRVDQNLSVTGEVLGTPAYMAPEQAAGKVHEVGTAADVYALGAVLYGLLTGRPPFTGDSVAVTLQKVISEEPARPRKLNASIPRDLETICLMCLEKEPAKRYPTAQSLADDLLRYLRNEPISARRVGALERGYKWVKRNKVVAGATAAVALALLVGAGVSLGFGLEARDQAAEATKQKNEANTAANGEKQAAARATTAAATADREKQDAIKARDDLKRSQDRLLASFTKVVLGPIATDTRTKKLTPDEVDAYWELVAQRNAPLAELFLEEATHTPLACKRLEARAEFALHAAIGLDADRRDRLDRMFLARMTDPKTTAQQRTSLALACARWGAASPRTRRESALALGAALTATPNPARFDPTHEFVTVAPYLEPEEAVRLAQQITDAMARPENLSTKSALLLAFLAVALHTEPERTALQLVDEMNYILVPHADLLIDRLIALAPRLTADQAARVVQRLADAMVKTDGFRLCQLAHATAALAPRLTAEQATRVAQHLTDAMVRTKGTAYLRDLAHELATVARYLKPEQAAAACDRAVRTLTAELTKSLTGDYRDPTRLAHGLTALTSYLPPEQAERVARRAADVLLTTRWSEGGPNPHIPASPTERPTAAQVAQWFTDEVTLPPENGRNRFQNLSVVTLGISAHGAYLGQCATTLAIGHFATPHTLLPALRLLYPHFQPHAHPLLPQELVELLKHPFCVGAPRRTILDSLEFTYQRPFKDQWEFVEYARKHQPQLNLVTPPKRPQP